MRFSALILPALLLLPFTPLRAEEAKAPPKPPKIGVLMATLCDSADDAGGKLVVKGAFDTLTAAEFPLTSTFTLCLRFQFQPEAYGEHRLRIEMAKPDGSALLEKKLETSIKFAPLQPDLPFLSRNILQNFKGVSFPAAGIYQVTVYLDDQVVSAQKLVVKKKAP